MAIGIENATITIQYLGAPSKVGGRRSIDNEVDVSVFWNEDLSKIQNKPRYIGKELKAEIIITFQPELVKPTPEDVIIKKGDDRYSIDTIDIIPSGFGVDGTYIIIAKEFEAR